LFLFRPYNLRNEKIEINFNDIKCNEMKKELSESLAKHKEEDERGKDEN